MFFKIYIKLSWFKFFFIVVLSFIHNSCGDDGSYNNSGFLTETKNYLIPPFIIVGDSGTILTSTDSVNWTIRNPGTSNNINSVAYGNGIFVAGANSTTILQSSDARNWSIGNTDAQMDVLSISFGLGSTGSDEYIFAIVGKDGFLESCVQCSPSTSSQNITWKRRQTNTNYNLNKIKWLPESAYGAGAAVVGDNGTIITQGSWDVWALKDKHTSNNLMDITYGNGIFVVVGSSGHISTSLDKKSWTNRTSPLGSKNINSITYVNNKFIAVGDSGSIINSSDGENWTSISTSTSNNLSAIGFGKNTFLVVGDSGTILTSKDGIIWNHIISGTSNNLNDIAFSE